jgi:hypothetical protein
MIGARSPWLWRVLVPSWRFFEAEDARYLLEVRSWRDGQAPSAFSAAVPAAARGKWAWLFAPEHNLRLFCHDLIEGFVFELAEKGPLAESAVAELASYQRVKELAGWFLRAETGLRFQLRLVVLREDDSAQELFVSPYYPVEG